MARRNTRHVGIVSVQEGDFEGPVEGVVLGRRERELGEHLEPEE